MNRIVTLTQTSSTATTSDINSTGGLKREMAKYQEQYRSEYHEGSDTTRQPEGM